MTEIIFISGYALSAKRSLNIIVLSGKKISNARFLCLFRYVLCRRGNHIRKSTYMMFDDMLSSISSQVY